MKVSDWLSESTNKLEQAGIGTARLDALVLLEGMTGRDRTWLLASPEAKISTTDLAKLKNVLNRRVGHEPLAYIRGKTEFYGREFLLTPAVLEPRPESETMIDLLKNLPGLPKRLSLADVGTGSGALGITAALEVPIAHVDLIDIDKQALKVAQANVDKFTLAISVVQSDLLSTTTAAYDVLLCNLPYVPDNFQLNPAAMHEPKLAIFGGPDGLDIYRRVFKQIEETTQKPLYILCEALPPQHAVLIETAKTAGLHHYKTDDFIVVLTPQKLPPA